MAKILVWLNPRGYTYHNIIISYRTSFEVGEVNGYGHILVNIYHIYDNVYSDNNLSLYEKRFQLHLKYAHIKNIPNRCRNKLADCLDRLSTKIRR